MRFQRMPIVPQQTPKKGKKASETGKEEDAEEAGEEGVAGTLRAGLMIRRTPINLPKTMTLWRR
jgi:hypothetical protein